MEIKLVKWFLFIFFVLYLLGYIFDSNEEVMITKEGRFTIEFNNSYISNYTNAIKKAISDSFYYKNDQTHSSKEQNLLGNDTTF